MAQPGHLGMWEYAEDRFLRANGLFGGWEL